MNKVSAVARAICNKFDLIAGIIFFINCCIVTLNVITRSALFELPIFGVYEIVCYLSLISVSLALAHSAFLGGHIRLTFFLEKFSEKKRMIVEIVINIVILINFILITQHLILYTYTRYLVGDVSAVMRIPIQFLMIFVVVGFFLLTLTSLIHLLEQLKKQREERG